MGTQVHIFGTARSTGKSVVAHGLVRLFRKQGRRAFLHFADVDATFAPVQALPPGAASSTIPAAQSDDNAAVDIVEFRTDNESLLSQSFSPMAGDFNPAPAFFVCDNEQENIIATTYGTIQLLPSAYRKALCGLILNNSSFTPSELSDISNRLQTITGVPVVGVIPRIDLPMALGAGDDSATRPIDAGILRFPDSRLSDVTALGFHPAVALRSIDGSGQFTEQAPPDILLLPDVLRPTDAALWMRHTGLEGDIRALVQSGTPVIALGNSGAALCSEFSIQPPVSDIPALNKRMYHNTGLGLIPARVNLQYDSVPPQLWQTNRVAGIFSCLAGKTFPERIRTRLSVTNSDDQLQHFAASEPDAGGIRTQEGFVYHNVICTHLTKLLGMEFLQDELVAELLRRKGIDDYSMNDTGSTTDPIVSILQKALDNAHVSI